jgi:4-nitrophenyl phosphatase
VYVIGEEPLQDILKLDGFEIADSSSGAEAVVVGLDRSVGWPQMAEAAFAIQEGAAFIGTNPDKSLPIERGFAPGNGAILAALEATTGVSPVVIGKPEPHLYLQAQERLGSPVENILAVGDRLETDILGGQGVGMPTALLLTGVTSRTMLESSDIQPNYIFDNLGHLSKALLDT